MENYNINEMRRALVRMYNKGNNGVITEALCKKIGISSVYFKTYVATVEKLFNAVSEYCRVKNSTTATDAGVKEAREAIYPIWKELLQSAEKDKFDRDLRVREDDISSLVGFVQTFMRNRNDVSLGTDKTFTAQKVWAIDDFNAFRKKVETDLGIRIAQVEVLSNDERDFLREERKILSAWRKATAHRDDLNKQIESLKAVLEKLTEPQAKELISNQIKEIEAKVKTVEESIAEASANHATLVAEKNKTEESGDTELTMAAD